MTSWRFWIEWPFKWKIFLATVALLVGAALVYFLVAFYAYPSSTFPYDVVHEFYSNEVILRSVYQDFFSFHVPADNHILFEKIVGQAPYFSSGFLYGSLFFTVLAVLVLLTVSTTLSWYRFVVGMSFLILFVFSLGIDEQQIAGFSYPVPELIIVVLYVTTAYYFHSIKPSVAFWVRFLVLVLLTLLIGVVIALASTLSWPILMISAHSIAPSLLITIWFLILIAHEPLVFIVYLIHRGSRENNFIHFIILSAIYLGNLLIGYLQQWGYISWGIWMIPMFFLFFVSSILGFWGYRIREPQYANLYPANPFGVWVYSSLCIIGFSTMGFLFASANDVGVDFFNRLSLYVYLGIGLIFLLYVISNFSPLLKQNIPIYKVLYKPRVMPFFTFRVMGLIATFAFLSYDLSWKMMFNQGYGVYYNALGMAHFIQEDYVSAQAYYQRATSYKKLNHQAHYALASIYNRNQQPLEEQLSYSRAVAFSPTPETFLNWSETYARTGDYARAVKILRQGLHKLPHDEALMNGLGLLYKKMGVYDSALYCFEQSSLSSAYDNMATTNQIALRTMYKSSVPIDSLWDNLSKGTLGTSTVSNLLAFSNTQHHPFSIPFLIPWSSDTLLTITQAALLNNYFIHELSNIDSAILDRALVLVQKPSNEQFSAYLIPTIAQAYFKQGNTRKAFSLIRQLAYLTKSKKYYYLLGIWSLEKNNPYMAMAYLTQSKGYSEQADEALACSLAECDSVQNSLHEWRKLLSHSSSVVSQRASYMIRALEDSQISVDDMVDEEKYAFIKYRIPLSDTSSFWTIWNSMHNADLKASVLIHKTRQWLAHEDISQATHTFNKVRGLKLSRQDLYIEIRQMNLRLLVAHQNWATLRDVLKEKYIQDFSQEEILFYQAMLAASDNQRKQATDKFLRVVERDIYDEYRVIKAVNYLRKNKETQERAFSIMVEALLLHPQSPAMLKTYILVTVQLGFLQEAQEALHRLRKILPPVFFNSFIDAHPSVFSVL